MNPKGPIPRVFEHPDGMNRADRRTFAKELRSRGAKPKPAPKQKGDARK